VPAKYSIAVEKSFRRFYPLASNVLPALVGHRKAINIFRIFPAFKDIAERRASKHTSMVGQYYLSASEDEGATFRKLPAAFRERFP
jgi:hypothetical protein